MDILDCRQSECRAPLSAVFSVHELPPDFGDDGVSDYCRGMGQSTLGKSQCRKQRSFPMAGISVDEEVRQYFSITIAEIRYRAEIILLVHYILQIG